jgi:trimethylguanosine synthase
VYGVADRIEFVVGDFLRLAPSLQADVVFLSPPWGGPQYLNVDAYDIESIMQSVGGTQLYKISLGITKNVAYYVPRNINTDQASRAVMDIWCHVSEIKYGQMTEYFFIQF